jgi:hypothetical protein
LRYQLTATYRGGGCTSRPKGHRHLPSPLGWFGRPSRKERPVGSLLSFEPDNAGGMPPSIRIPGITPRHSLSPTSFTRNPMGSPCGSLSPKGGLRAYHVPRKYPSRLGSAPTPVARHLRWRS